MSDMAVGTVCEDCLSLLPLEVQHSNAGYYLGYFCPNCGPHERISAYYKTKEIAEKKLEEFKGRAAGEIWMLMHEERYN